MDAVGLLHVLRRRLVPLLLCLVAGVIGGVLLNSSTAKRYESTAQVFVNIPTASSIQNSFQGVQLTSDLLPSYAEIAQSRSVVGKVRERLSLPDSVESLRGSISARALPQKLILEISARDGDPLRARSIANTATLALADTVADLEKSRAPGTAVQLQVIDPAVRGKQVAPRDTYNLLLGLLLGLASGVVAAVVLDALDRSVKTGAQAEVATRAPVLGVVPRMPRGKRALAIVGNDPAGENYRTLRTGVTFADPDAPVRILLVTSPSSGEGKTTTAVNLAIALAQSGERTVLVDADLRRSNVAAMLGLEGAVGVSSVITRSAGLAEALQTWQDGLLVLPAGALPPNPSEMVGSRAMAKLLSDLDEFADVIVVDAPPVLPVTDAVVLATQVEGVILVVRAGKTQRGQAAEARRRLDNVNAHVVGAVLNGVKRSTAAGYYAAHHPQVAPRATASDGSL
ncbi:MAG: chromosome partitioning protein [Frankiales bacterium]|nr:chromosome partitioning protein [Frankiales bacterium]